MKSIIMICYIIVIISSMVFVTMVFKKNPDFISGIITIIVGISASVMVVPVSEFLRKK